MSQPSSAWVRATIAWERCSQSISQPITGWAESTRRVSDEESLHCQACGRWVEPVLAQFSRYTGEPLCPGCAEAEETNT
jgi:hypothetical protein